MSDPTSAELDQELATLQIKRDELKAAEEEAARHPRHPLEVVYDLLRALGDHAGHPPGIQKLLAELDKVTAPQGAE